MADAQTETPNDDSFFLDIDRCTDDNPRSCELAVGLGFAGDLLQRAGLDAAAIQAVAGGKRITEAEAVRMIEDAATRVCEAKSSKALCEEAAALVYFISPKEQAPSGQ